MTSSTATRPQGRSEHGEKLKLVHGVDGRLDVEQLGGAWVLQALGQCWAVLIERALVGRDGAPLGELRETLDFVRYALEHSQQFAPA